MSYVSLLKNIPEILSQPTGIAAIASLGIHGAIALVVPLVPVNSDKSQDTSNKSVGVLELSQADQTRLPQAPGINSVAMQPQVPFPGQVALQSQFPQQPQLNNIPGLNSQGTVLPPLPPPVNSQLSLPPIATTPGNYRIAPLPQSQSLRIASNRSFRFHNSGLNNTGNNFTPPAPPSLNEQNVIPEANKPLPIDKLPQLNAAKLPEDLPTNLPPNSTEETPQTNNNPANVAPIPAEVAPVGETPKTEDELGFVDQNVPKWQQGSTLKTPELPTENSERGLIAKLNSYQDLRKALQQEYPNSQEKPVIRSTVSTDKTSQEVTVLGFVVVNPQGQILDIKFQNESSIPPDLKLKAREYFSTNIPKADKQISRYPFNLRFQNSVNNASTSEQKTPALVAPQPVSTPAANNSQPKTSPALAPKPLPQLQLRETTPQPLPQVNLKKDQPAPTVTISPAATTEPSKNSELTSTVESSRTLIEKLRAVRQQQKQESSSSEK